MAEFLQFGFSGVTVGSVYALVALGFTLIYNASDVVNFAQGEFLMIGGMTSAVLFAAGVPLPLAAVTAVAAAAAAGFLLERLAIAPVRDAPPATLIIITIGASLLLRGIAQIVFGKQIHRLPSFTGDAAIAVGGAMLPVQSLWVLLGAGVMFVALRALLGGTLVGFAVRATAANRLAARLVGIEVPRIFALAFVVSAVIGAVGGILVTPITLTRYDIGTLLALKGFAAAMLGGMGNPLGAVVGGLSIGLLESFGAGYVSSTYKDAVAFVAMLGVLMFLPGGLLGASKLERV
ncbi:branched-chain amino acid ABC transporter permease [Azospirillum sp. ST 5-10]|uniref:branched-chain amino acid ABC transporter permease n=1 Tax=unclassified Azospirillum TaxID=2630922 RepID=UPI003F49F23D